MKNPHIFFSDRKLTCSQCGESEMLDENNNLKKFKLNHLFDKNIVRPTCSNPDIKHWAECLTCKRQTGLYPSPYLYY